jgi:hypothetical protein
MRAGGSVENEASDKKNKTEEDATDDPRHSSVSVAGVSATASVGDVRTESLSRNDEPPDPRNREAFQEWLKTKPREWSVVIAVRAALRVLPLARTAKFGSEEASATLLPVFRATAIARFAAVYPNRAIEGPAAATAARAARAAAAAATAAAFAAFAARAAAAAATAGSEAAAIRQDALALTNRVPAEGLARTALWQPGEGMEAYRQSFEQFWIALRNDLVNLGNDWKVWTDWYDGLLGGSPPAIQRSEEWDAAFTDVEHSSYPWEGPLPWDDGAEAVNLAIKARLDTLVSQKREFAQEVPRTETETETEPRPREAVESQVTIPRQSRGL